MFFYDFLIDLDYLKQALSVNLTLSAELKNRKITYTV